MNDKGNRYALAALRDKRASLSSEIIHLQRQIRARKESLAHVDATLKLLDPSLDPRELPSKRRPKRIRLFRQGELGRLILGAMRDADQAMGTQAIISGVVAAGGHGESARAAMGQRVRANLAYLERRGKVSKTGSGGGARWELIR